METNGTEASGTGTSSTGTSSTPPRDDAAPEAGPAQTAPPLPDDPRVPRPEDAEPTRSKELGGAAPAVGGPGTPG